MSADPARDQSALTEPEAKRERSMLGRWFAFVRRARLGRERKRVALVIGSYANNDGTAVRCGVASLAVDCEIGYSTARRHLAWMREVQLIELVRHGNPRKGLADVYRLILGPKSKVLELPEDEYEALKDELREANRAGQKARRIGDQRSPKSSAETKGEATGKTTQEDPAGEVSALIQPSAETGDQRSLRRDQRSPMGERPPPQYTSPDKTFLPTGGAPPPDPRRPQAPPSSGLGNEQRNLINKGETKPPQNRTTTHAARGTAPVGQPTEPPAETQASGDQPRRETKPRREGPCRHGRNSRARSDGQPRCPECREEPPPQEAQIIQFPLASGGSP